jgi:hypothetical protein
MAVYITVSEVARVLGWSYLKTLRWLRKAGAIVRRNDRLVTTPERLIEAFPEVYDRIAQRLHGNT